MSSYLYPGGQTIWHTTYETDAHTWLLLNNAALFNFDNLTTADIEPWEITVAGYARQPMTGYIHTVSSQDLRFCGIGPSWTGMAAGQYIGALVLADETADRLLAWWDITPHLATGIGELDINFPDLGAVTPTPPPGTQAIHNYGVNP